MQDVTDPSVQPRGETKSCQTCQTPFVVAPEDLEFYHKVSPTFAGQTYEIPAPTLCPDCRQQRRLSWRGEKKFYRRPCDKCAKSLITVFHTDPIYTVYCPDCWWSDGWSTIDSGRDFDFSRPFFTQFEELVKSTPLLSAWMIACENSEFNNNVSYLKDCYLLSSSNHNEDCYFGYYVNDTKDSLDLNSVKKSELCYECVECVNCYNLKYSKNSVNCSDSWFLENCIGVRNCFGCANLKQKEYCWFNEQLTKEAYESKIAEFKSGSRQAIAQMREQVESHHLEHPYKYMVGENNEDVTGNSVFQAKNTHWSFDCLEVENLKYCQQMQEAKDCYDVSTWGRPAEWLYECMGVGNTASRNAFCTISRDCSENLYSYLCMFSKNLFGCVGVKHGEYLILNKQYTKDEYEALVPRIIEHMRSTGEWGEFFPGAIAPFGYNESLASDWFDITKDEVVQKGFKWRTPDPRDFKPQDTVVPDDIADVKEDIAQQLLSCKWCDKNYKIIPHELAFYKANALPIPELCPECRHEARMSKRNPRHLWPRRCMCREQGHQHQEDCTTTFETSFAPDRPEIVYCERCYSQVIA